MGQEVSVDANFRKVRLWVLKILVLPILFSGFLLAPKFAFLAESFLRGRKFSNSVKFHEEEFALSLS